MTKTITEYQPMIYSALLAEPSRRRLRRKLNIRYTAVGVRLCYALAILAIMSQTGLAAWNWQFWLIFTPVLAMGENLLLTLRRRAA
jgi:hypothetical protein